MLTCAHIFRRCGTFLTRQGCLNHEAVFQSALGHPQGALDRQARTARLAWLARLACCDPCRSGNRRLLEGQTGAPAVAHLRRVGNGSGMVRDHFGPGSAAEPRHGGFLRGNPDPGDDGPPGLLLAPWLPAPPYSLPVARPCSVCNHPDRGQVEAELLQGISLRTVGGRHGLSSSALQRHRTTHMAAIPEAELPPSRPPMPAPPRVSIPPGSGEPGRPPVAPRRGVRVR